MNKVYISCECSCDSCKAMCKDPCFPTPDDVQKLIAAGYKDRLMPSVYLSHLHGLPFGWPVVAPVLGRGGWCTFYKHGLCELHSSGLKPTEGKIAIHDMSDNGLRRNISFTWVSKTGIEMMKQYPDTENLTTVLQTLLRCRI